MTGTPAIGEMVIANATDGSLGTSAMAKTSPFVGVIVHTAAATGKYYPVMLTLD